MGKEYKPNFINWTAGHWYEKIKNSFENWFKTIFINYFMNYYTEFFYIPVIFKRILYPESRINSYYVF